MNILEKIYLFITGLILTIVPATTFTEGVVGQPRSFIPTQAITQTDKTISHLLYRGLFKYDIYGTLQPDLADTWTVSEDGITYTIKLKDNQYWTNGRKINSDDLIYTSFKTPDLSGVATDKVDDLTVRYTLPNKYAPFLGLLTVGVMPSEAEEKSDPLMPVSSGDFRVSRIKRSGDLISRVILTSKNPEHKIKKLIFRYYSNQTELETAAQLGEIDAFLSSRTFESERFKKYELPQQGIFYALYFNMDDPQLKEGALRVKLANTLPIDQVIYGKGITVQGPISRSFFTRHDLDFNYFDQNYRANAENIRLTLKVPDIPIHRETAAQIEKIWEAALDINIDVNTVDADNFVQDVIESGDFQIVLYGQEVSRDPDRYVLWHSTQQFGVGLNIPRYENVRSDRALEEGRNELDFDQRIVHYNEFQKSVHDDIPALFLYHPYSLYYVNRYVQGIGEKYTFSDTDRFLDFYNWERYATN